MKVFGQIEIVPGTNLNINGEREWFSMVIGKWSVYTQDGDLIVAEAYTNGPRSEQILVKVPVE